MTNDDIIDLRTSLLFIDQPSVTQQNVLRDCDIALRLVRCKDETALEARMRVERYLRASDQDMPVATVASTLLGNLRALQALNRSRELDELYAAVVALGELAVKMTK